MKSNTSKLMQVLLQRGAAGTLGAVGALAALGLFSADAMAGISSTRHNLTTTNPNTTDIDGVGAQNRSTSLGTEICAFCHTPHAANTNMTAAPLWNKAIPTTVYTTYERVTMQAGSGTAQQPGDNSMICLSCHDGTQAMDNMINKPGSYNYDATGASAGYSWSGGNVTADGKMTGFAQITGDDLTNDHPIGIPYCGGGLTSANNVDSASTAGCLDSAFNPPVDVKGDGIVLFPNTGAIGQLTVECGSCHDPHNSVNNSFLRISNASSAVCLSCHNK